MSDHNDEALNSLLKSILNTVNSGSSEPLEMTDPEDDTVVEGIPMNDLISVKFIRSQFKSIDEIAGILDMEIEGNFVKNILNAIIDNWAKLDDEQKMEWV